MKLSQLRSLYMDVGGRHVDHIASVFLLHFLGCTLFVDKINNCIPISYLTLLVDLNKIHQYTQGVASLAYLYRQLRTISWYDTKQISNYLTLLQTWIYDHFPTCAPSHNPNYTSQLPRVQHWGLCTCPQVDQNPLSELREAIDDLPISDVCSLSPYLILQFQF